MNKPVVNVVVIGAMKCGTTAIYHFFKKNEVFGVNRKKEVNFFLNEYDEKSLAAYNSSFLPGELRVDVSPNYSKRHLYKTKIAKEINRANPEARIIFLVRDPLKRIESHLYHSLLRDRINRSRLSETEYLQPFIMTSSYLFQIRPFLDEFKKEQILVLQQEQMRNDPSRFIEKLYKFLDLPSSHHKEIDEYYSGDKRYWIPRYDLVNKILGTSFLFRIYNPFWSFLNIKPKPIFLDEKTKASIRTRLAWDMTEFCSLFGLDRTQWGYFFDGSEKEKK